MICLDPPAGVYRKILNYFYFWFYSLVTFLSATKCTGGNRIETSESRNIAVVETADTSRPTISAIDINFNTAIVTVSASETLRATPSDDISNTTSMLIFTKMFFANTGSNDYTWTLTINPAGITAANGVVVTQGSKTGTLVGALQNEWTISINSAILAK